MLFLHHGTEEWSHYTRKVIKLRVHICPHKLLRKLYYICVADCPSVEMSKDTASDPACLVIADDYWSVWLHGHVASNKLIKPNYLIMTRYFRRLPSYGTWFTREEYFDPTLNFVSLIKFSNIFLPLGDHIWYFVAFLHIGPDSYVKTSIFNIPRHVYFIPRYRGLIQQN